MHAHNIGQISISASQAEALSRLKPLIVLSAPIGRGLPVWRIAAEIWRTLSWFVWQECLVTLDTSNPLPDITITYNGPREILNWESFQASISHILYYVVFLTWQLMEGVISINRSLWHVRSFLIISTRVIDLLFNYKVNWFIQFHRSAACGGYFSARPLSVEVCQTFLSSRPLSDQKLRWCCHVWGVRFSQCPDTSSSTTR